MRLPTRAYVRRGGAGPRSVSHVNEEDGHHNRGDAGKHLQSGAHPSCRHWRHHRCQCRYRPTSYAATFRRKGIRRVRPMISSGLARPPSCCSTVRWGGHAGMVILQMRMQAGMFTPFNTAWRSAKYLHCNVSLSIGRIVPCMVLEVLTKKPKSDVTVLSNMQSPNTALPVAWVARGGRGAGVRRRHCHRRGLQWGCGCVSAVRPAGRGCSITGRPCGAAPPPPPARPRPAHKQAHTFRRQRLRSRAAEFTPALWPLQIHSSHR